MGKNNSVKKIDEEQILKRFEYTVQAVSYTHLTLPTILLV